MNQRTRSLSQLLQPVARAVTQAVMVAGFVVLSALPSVFVGAC